MNVRTMWIFAWLVLCPLAAVNAGAETFSVSYDAVVTSAIGPHAAAFPVGQRVIVSYSLDALAADSISDPQRGSFDGALLSLSMSFPGLGVFVIAGPAGRVQTFDNATDGGPSSDQAFFAGGPISAASTLGGEPISSVEVDFLSDFVVPPPQPSMLTSDALPLFKLPTTDAFAVLGTGDEFTSVHFEASPTPASPVCDIELNHASYANGEPVIARVLRVANPAAQPVTIEYKLWIELAGLGSFTYTRGGANGSVVLPAGFDQDFGPLPLFTVNSAFPRGLYTFGCRLVSPVTGEQQSETINVFAIP